MFPARAIVARRSAVLPGGGHDLLIHARVFAVQCKQALMALSIMPIRAGAGEMQTASRRIGESLMIN
jgi:hypothetical protein